MMNNEAFHKALNILSPEEKLAVSLMRVERKSTWEAGEIMQKSHYKFLEIKARGEQFITIFTEHYTIHNVLVPDEAIHPLIRAFRHWAKATIGERLKTKEVYLKLEKEGITKKECREAVYAVMAYMKVSEKVAIRNFYNLLVEFDKWNNFRILPRDFQEPSAFKRRNKTRQKKNLKYLLNMPEKVVQFLINDFALAPKSKSLLKAYIPLYRKDEPETSENLLIYASEVNLKRLSKAGYPFFRNPEYSADLLRLIILFGESDSHTPKFGQQFWPKFRIAIMRAENFLELENLLPARKHVGLFDFDSRVYAKLEKRIYESQRNLFGTSTT